MLRPYVLRGHNVDSCRYWPLVQRQDTRLWIWVWWFESTGANPNGARPLEHGPETRSAAPVSFRDPGAARAGGYVLVVAGLLVAVGLIFHPVSAGGLEV